MKTNIIFIIILCCFFVFNLKSNDITNVGDFTFTANNISYNYQNNVLLANGNVIIKSDTVIISADEVFYDNKNKIIIAKGNVIYKNNKNETMYMNYLEFDTEISAFLMEKISIHFGRESIIKANTITKQNADDYCADNMIFTFCSIKEASKPTWEIKSSYGVYNETDKTVSLYNPILKVKGIPLLWLPYIQLSNLQNERKGGLLPFKYSNNSINGYSLIIPLYIPIGLSNELTINTHLYAKNLNFFKTSQNPLITGVYDGYLANTVLNMQFSYMQDSKIQKNNKPVNNWHMFTKGSTYFSNILKTSYIIEKTTNIAYLNNYEINPNSSNNLYLTQSINNEIFLNNSYLSISYNDYESLQNNLVYREIKTEQLLFYNFNNFGNVKIKNQAVGFFSKENKKFDHYLNSKQYIRLVNNINYDKNINLPIGYISSALEVQSVYYNIDNANKLEKKKPQKAEQKKDQEKINTDKNDSYIATGFSSIYNIPLAYSTTNNIFFVNPNLGLSYTKYIANNRYNHNIDKANLYYTANNIMNINHYNSFDIYEEKIALKYGFSTNIVKKNDEVFSSFFGQLINLKSTNKSTLTDKTEKSNYFLTSSWQIVNNLWLRFEGTANLDFKLISNRSSINYYHKNISIGASYNYYNNLDQQIFNYYKEQEINSYLSLNVFSFFYIKASASFSLYNKEQAKIFNAKEGFKFKSLDYSVSYLDDCLSVILSIKQNVYTNVPDSYNIQIILKKF